MVFIFGQKKRYLSHSARGVRGEGGSEGGGHYGQSHYKNKRNKNTNFASTGPIRFKIGQRCGFPTQNFSSLALKGTKILTFAYTHWGFETGLQLGNLSSLHDMNQGLITNVFIILFSSSLWPQYIYIKIKKIKSLLAS